MLKLKEIRLERNITQQEISDKTNISRSVISQYENGIVEPTANVIVKLAEFFQITTDEILGRTDDFGSVIAPVAPALSEDEAELVALYRSLLPDYKALALTNLRTWAGGAKSPKNAINHRA